MLQSISKSSSTFQQFRYCFFTWYFSNNSNKNKFKTTIEFNSKTISNRWVFPDLLFHPKMLKNEDKVCLNSAAVSLGIDLYTFCHWIVKILLRIHVTHLIYRDVVTGKVSEKAIKALTLYIGAMYSLVHKWLPSKKPL